MLFSFFSTNGHIFPICGGESWLNKDVVGGKKSKNYQSGGQDNYSGLESRSCIDDKDNVFITLYFLFVSSQTVISIPKRNLVQKSILESM